MVNLESSVKELEEKLSMIQHEKVEQFEKVLRAMTRKVLSLESEIEQMKRNSIPCEGKEPVLTKSIEDIVVFDNNDVKDKCSTPKEEKKKVAKNQNKEDLMSCSLCKYKCKKRTSLEKHMITTHQEHQCKECQEKCSTFMELLKHISKQHCKEKDEISTL